MDASGSRPGNFCLSIDEGVSHPVSNFGMYQRLFSVYDGPAFQDSNAYLNITKRTIDDCKPFTDSVNQAGRCDPPDYSARHGRTEGMGKRLTSPGHDIIMYLHMWRFG